MFSILPTLEPAPVSCCPLWGQFAGVISAPLEVACAVVSLGARARVDGSIFWGLIGDVAEIAEIMDSKKCTL